MSTLLTTFATHLLLATELVKYADVVVHPKLETNFSVLALIIHAGNKFFDLNKV